MSARGLFEQGEVELWVLAENWDLVAADARAHRKEGPPVQWLSLKAPELEVLEF